MLYKVINKGKDVRQFRDHHKGEDVVLKPKESVITDRPPEENVYFKVEEFEEKKKEKILIKEGVQSKGLDIDNKEGE